MLGKIDHTALLSCESCIIFGRETLWAGWRDPCRPVFELSRFAVAKALAVSMSSSPISVAVSRTNFNLSELQCSTLKQLYILQHLTFVNPLEICGSQK